MIVRFVELCASAGSQLAVLLQVLARLPRTAGTRPFSEPVFLKSLQPPACRTDLLLFGGSRLVNDTPSQALRALMALLDARETARVATCFTENLIRCRVARSFAYSRN